MANKRWQLGILVLIGLLLAGCMAGRALASPPPRREPPPHAVAPARRPPGRSPWRNRLDRLLNPNPAAAAPGAPPTSDLTEQATLELIQYLHDSSAEHVDQGELLALVQSGATLAAFDVAFEAGDELFETQFNTLDGVGANVGNGLRFSQLPRADLAGAGEWANHFPKRITGPNAEACNDCHGTPVDDGAGRAANNNVRDPLHTGQIDQFIVRNTPHVFAAGAIQVLAEEMTEELHAQRQQGFDQACATNQPVQVALQAKGVDFGTLTVTPTATQPCQTMTDEAGISGINPDLVVRPFQWKGVIATVRAFNRDAAHQELGMQASEIVGDNVDGDADGVVNELTVGDQTALALYVAAQPRPTSRLELSELGLIDPLPAPEKAAIRTGEQRFTQIGCAACHTPQLTIQDPVFYEPSQNPFYRDETFPAGQDPVAQGLDPALPISFDLTRDQHDNVIPSGGQEIHLGALPTAGQGGALVALYGDLKRHDLGPAVAEAIDDEGIPATIFLTENLWGVGSTAPYLHDGRATTLAEAILAHGGEAEAARLAFTQLAPPAQSELIAFLNNLVLYKYTPATEPTAPVVEVKSPAEE